MVLSTGIEWLADTTVCDPNNQLPAFVPSSKLRPLRRDAPHALSLRQGGQDDKVWHSPPAAWYEPARRRRCLS